MKKLFTLLSLALVAFVAQAKTCEVTIHIDDPSHAKKVVFNDKTYTFDADGYIRFSSVEGNGARIFTADPWVLTDKCFYTINDDIIYDIDGGALSEYYFYVDCDYADKIVYEFKTATVEDLRKNACTVNIVGKPEKMKLFLRSWINPREVDNLKEGENIVKFLDSEYEFVVSSTDDNHPVYEVYHNGQKHPQAYGVWSVEAKNGDKIDVYTEYPPEEVTVTIDYKGDASPASIKEYTIGGVSVADASKPIAALKGERMSISFNNINYIINSLKVNGEYVEVSEWSVSYGCILTEDINIEVDQTKKPVYTAKVTVDDYTHIKYNEAGTEKTPTSNNFVVEMAQDAVDLMPIYFYPANVDLQIVKCTADGVDAEYAPIVNGYYVAMKEKVQEIVITTSPIRRNDNFVFYYDNPDAATDPELGFRGWYMDCDLLKRDVAAEVKQGYNTVAFAPIDGEFRFGVYGDMEIVKKNVHVYLNNEVFDMFDEGGFWRLTPTNGDVMKAYISREAPAFYDVTFHVTDAAAIEYTKVDGVRKVEVVDGLTISELPSSSVVMNIAKGYEVKVGSEWIKPGADGLFRFTVNGETTVTVAPEGTGIESVTAADGADSAVHNIMGVKVSNGATDSLPAGLYIKGGKKILVK